MGMWWKEWAAALCEGGEEDRECETSLGAGEGSAPRQTSLTTLKLSVPGCPPSSCHE